MSNDEIYNKFIFKKISDDVFQSEYDHGILIPTKMSWLTSNRTSMKSLKATFWA